MDPQKPSDDHRLSVPARHRGSQTPAPDRDAAAQLMRQQISQLYDQQGAQEHAEQTAANPGQANPQTAARPGVDAEHWKNYHTQWQKYYQQYYERYYLAQINKRQRQLTGEHSAQAAPQAFVTAGQPETQPESLTRDQAVSELRDNLVTKIREHSGTVRRSRHFMPIAMAIVVALVFGILQYNRLIVAQVRAYVSPGSINPANLVVDPTTDIKVGPEPKLIIPKINVDAPVVYDVPSIAENVVQDKLKSGVVHYPIPGANSLPGQKGNTVILGHSSNDVFDDGGYKFVFVQLDKLDTGDTFYLNYQGTRYTYSVTEKKIINPNEVNTLVINNGKPLATLVTCTPPGTALKRLVVIAEQVSPDPDRASNATEDKSSGESKTIPGNSPTLFERLFGQ